MNTDDVYTEEYQTNLKIILRSALGAGKRIGNNEKLMPVDTEILIDGHIEELSKNVEQEIDVMLHDNIPAFDRLCWCKQCKGVLDCRSDHK